MKVQTENPKVQLALEPWKLLALGVGAGATFMAAAVAVAAFVFRGAGVGGGKPRQGLDDRAGVGG